MSFTYIVVVFCCPVRILSHIASPQKRKEKKVEMLVVMVYLLQESPEVTL